MAYNRYHVVMQQKYKKKNSILSIVLIIDFMNAPNNNTLMQTHRMYIPFVRPLLLKFSFETRKTKDIIH